MKKSINVVCMMSALVLSTLISAESSGGAPELVPVQGVLTDAAGVAVTGPVTVKFTLYDAQVGGAALWTEDQTISPDNGFFSAYLGDVNNLDLQLFNNNMVVWLGVKVGDSDELPRVYLGSSPFTAFSQYCGTVPAHGHPFSEITGVLPAGQLPAGVVVGAQECQGTDRVAAVDAAGKLVCKEGTAVYAAGKGIAIDSLAISVKPCTDNQVLVWNGGDWKCSTQNFVDLSTNQTVGGIKTFSSTIKGSIDGNAVTATISNTALAVSAGSIVTASFAPTAKAPLCGTADSAASALTSANSDDSSALGGHPASYFLNAANLTGTLSPDRIADGALPGAKLASKAVTGGKIADTTIVAGNIADAAIVDRTINDTVVFTKVQNSVGTDQFDITHAGKNLLIAGAGSTSVSFDPAAHKVTISSTAGTGTVTSITQGNGILLTPNPITSSGTVEINPNYTQRRVANSCAVGSAMTTIGSDGTATCLNSITNATNAGTASDLAAGSVLSAAKGGTGQSSYTTGDLLYASGGATLSRLADAATGNALLSGGVGTAPAWGKVSLATHVSGTLPVTSGGTGSVTQNFVDLTTNQTIAGTKTFSSAIAGSITGNAGTVTNGVYTTGSYADPAWIASLAVTKLSGAITVANGGTGNTSVGTAGYVCYSDGSKYNFTPHMRVDSSSVESPNIILGYSGNTFTAGVKGASVGGGGSSSYENKVTDEYGSIGGGRANQAGDNAGTTIDRGYATVSGGRSNKATGAYTAIGGGYGNNAIAEDAVVAGGLNNDANGVRSFLGGGEENTAAGMYSTVAGGRMVSANGDYSTIGGGYNNQTTAEFAAVGGGTGNLASGVRSAVAGGSGCGAAGGYSSVGGGDRNTATGDYSAIAGGTTNNTYDYNTFIGGGVNNVAGVFGGTMNEGSYSSVVGGSGNSVSAQMTFIGGGQSNSASSLSASVLGGYSNEASGQYSSVVGGYDNTASGYISMVGGGYANIASGDYSTVAGGSGNTASGVGSFASGRNARANRDGCFIWNDGTNLDPVYCGANYRTVFRSSGGFVINTNASLTSGVYVAAGGGSWLTVSAREKKENFEPVDTGRILDSLDAAEITSWNYKSQDPSIRHIGLMANEFNTLLPGLGGEGMDHINSLDADGIAIAAVKGLISENKKLKARDTELEARLGILEAQNRELSKRLASIDGTSVGTGREATDPRVDALENRIRELEKKAGREKASLWWLAAFAVVAGAVAMARRENQGKES
jgi:hypothetical protein